MGAQQCAAGLVSQEVARACAVPVTIVKACKSWTVTWTVKTDG